MSFGHEDQAIAVETIDRMAGYLTPWEERFVKSVREQLNAKRPLTERQVETLERIYMKRTG